jgi:WD40 repeat protein
MVILILLCWDVKTGTAIGPALKGHSSSVTSVVFLPDGRKVASASDDTTVCLWDVQTGTTIGPALQGHSSWVMWVIFSPDGKKLASASFDNTVHLWCVETGTAIGPARKGHSDFVRSVVFLPDGRKLASASFDKTVCLWDVKTGTAIGSVLEGHSCSVMSVIFSKMGESWLQHQMTIQCVCGMLTLVPLWKLERIVPFEGMIPFNPRNCIPHIPGFISVFGRVMANRKGLLPCTI